MAARAEGKPQLGLTSSDLHRFRGVVAESGMHQRNQESEDLDALHESVRCCDRDLQTCPGPMIRTATVNPIIMRLTMP